MSTRLPPADNAGLPTLAEAKVSGLRNVSGTCTNGDEFLRLVNSATKRLMYRGDWPGTELPMVVSVKRGVTTFPRVVGTIRALNICNHPVPIFGDWYRFLPYQRNCAGLFGGWRGWIGPRPAMTTYGRSCTFDVIPTDTCVVQAYGITDDAGKVIVIFGKDASGNDLRTDNGDGTWSDGVSLTIGPPFVPSALFIKTITRVIKPITQGNVQLIAMDVVTTTQTTLANYEPGETNPSYAQYQLGVPCTPVININAIALVKLMFIPARVDTDPILIPNLEALSLFIQGIRFEEAGDRTNAKLYQADAVKELNLEMADQEPEDQLPIDVNPFGTARPSRAGVGRVI